MPLACGRAPVLGRRSRAGYAIQFAGLLLLGAPHPHLRPRPAVLPMSFVVIVGTQLVPQRSGTRSG
jgi:hypothetical protein